MDLPCPHAKRLHGSASGVKLYACSKHPVCAAKVCGDAHVCENLADANTPDWAVGLTTAPRNESYLAQTLASLRAAGFHDVRLFVDGAVSTPAGYAVTKRDTASGAWPNWLLSLGELILRNPDATKIAIFQDDIILSRNVRQFLDDATLPQDGYINLYTFPGNEQIKLGFHQAKQHGKGAVGLVFPRHVALRILSHPYAFARVHDKRLGHKNIDGAVWTIATQIGLKEYIHTPSLIQHIGDVSSINNNSHPQAITFQGEQFDARDIGKGKPPAIKRSDKILLYGYNTASGLGYLNRDIATNIDNVHKWLVLQHDRFPILPLHEDVDSIVCNGRNVEKIKSACKGCGTLLFAETPIHTLVVKTAKNMGLRVVCVPMFEWFSPKLEWTPFVDEFLCPTKQCYEAIRKTHNARYVPWPVDTDQFQFTKREKATTFVYAEGNGGYKGRKGAAEFYAAMRLAPELQAVVFSQRNRARGVTELDIPPNCEMREASDRCDIYRAGDVLVYPSHCDGIGLQMLEAQACGMPVMATAGEPMREHNPAWTFAAEPYRQTAGRVYTAWRPKPEAIAAKMREIAGQDISEQSEAARAWAVGRSWESLNAVLLQTTPPR